MSRLDPSYANLNFSRYQSAFTPSFQLIFLPSS